MCVGERDRGREQLIEKYIIQNERKIQNNFKMKVKMENLDKCNNTKNK